MIKKLCKDCDEIVKYIDRDSFKGYWYNCHDEIIQFLEDNSELFTKDGIDFGNSLFIPILHELTSYELLEGEQNENDNRD